MQAPEPGANLASKLTPRYIATLIAGALVILVIGSALRPRTQAPGAASPPTQTELRRLQGLAERQSLETMTSHFAGIAADVEPSLLRVEPRSGGGIAWTPELVVGAGQDEPREDSVTVATSTGDRVAALRVVGGPGLPVAAFRVATPLTPVSRRAPDAPKLRAGQWLIAVWAAEAGPAFAPGHYVDTRATRCGDLPANEVSSSLTLGAEMAGAGLFDLDKSLVAIVLPCEGRYLALTPQSVSSALEAGRSADGRLQARYGFRVVAPTEAIKDYLRARSGVLVSQVWTGFPAEVAGLHPGDVIMKVDGNAVASLDELEPLLAQSEQGESRLGVWRARQSREMRLIASASPGQGKEDPAISSGMGLGLATPAPGFPIGPVEPESAAAQAGIREGDQLLRIDFNVPRSANEAARALARRSAPLFVEIGRGAWHFGVLLGPQ